MISSGAFCHDFESKSPPLYSLAVGFTYLFGWEVREWDIRRVERQKADRTLSVRQKWENNIFLDVSEQVCSRCCGCCCLKS